jgi:hypothetical protein
MRLAPYLILALFLPAAAMAQAVSPPEGTAQTTITTRPARTPTPAQAAQQQRMRDCNAEARRRNLTGTARQAFMRPCLAGNAPSAGGDGATGAPPSPR